MGAQTRDFTKLDPLTTPMSTRNSSVIPSNVLPTWWRTCCSSDHQKLSSRCSDFSVLEHKLSSFQNETKEATNLKINLVLLILG